MVCTKKATQTAAAVVTAASSMFSGYTGADATPVSNVATKDASTATVSAANSGIKGFNYGAFFLDQSAKQQADFAYEFNRAQNLANTTGWNSARLYTTSE